MKVSRDIQDSENIVLGCVDQQGNGKSFPLKDASEACRAEIFGRALSEDFANTLIYPTPVKTGPIPMSDQMNTRFQQRAVSRALSADNDYQALQKEVAAALRGK